MELDVWMGCKDTVVGFGSVPQPYPISSNPSFCLTFSAFLYLFLTFTQVADTAEGEGRKETRLMVLTFHHNPQTDEPTTTPSLPPLTTTEEPDTREACQTHPVAVSGIK
ncbi:hypothetical protein Pcinc_030985 [Petrolisthes cinctipes]|uniref:Uncharacterized protein n=1 Tax=Petrolisthes cinctipes TaxID=88211 RepID=A0AAE1EX17_PETCI|nr:hypothetical protein Pcinc_030985 [Petrolisthes cinctipes]